MDQVAERLAELRERRALTLRELGELSGVAADTINQIELGHRKARPSTLRKLARALGIDVQEFYAEPALGKTEAPRGAGLSEEQERREAQVQTASAHMRGQGTLDGGEGILMLGPLFLEKLFQRMERREISADEAMAEARAAGTRHS